MPFAPKIRGSKPAGLKTLARRVRIELAATPLVAGLLVGIGWSPGPARAQDEAAAPPAGLLGEAPSPAESAAGLTAGPADDPAAPAEPLRSRSGAADDAVQANAQFLAAHVLLRGGDPEAALEEFLAARKRSPDSSEILRAVVAVALELGREELAAEVAAELSDRLPDDWQLARTLARLKLSAGDVAGRTGTTSGRRSRRTGPRSVPKRRRCCGDTRC